MAISHTLKRGGMQREPADMEGIGEDKGHDLGEGIRHGLGEGPSQDTGSSEEVLDWESSPGSMVGLQQQIARLQALLEASRSIHSTILLDDVLAAVAKIAARELELVGAWFSTYPVIYGEQVAADADGVCSFPIHDHLGGLLTELRVYAEGGRLLTLEESDFLEHLAVQAAVAIENAAYYERAIQWERVQRDLSAARAIQQSLVPRLMPQIAGYDLAARFNPCYEVGGDYIDILAYGEGRHLLVVADVAGKGLASALIGNAFRAALRAMAVDQVPLEVMATRLNTLQYQEGEEARRRYLTAVFALLDPAAHSLAVVNAGHVPTLLVHCDGSPMTVIDSSGPPIGMLPAIPGLDYKVETHPFPIGSRLLLCTDGLTEIFRAEEEYTIAGVARTVQSTRCRDAETLLEAVWRDVLDFADGAPQDDDMSAMALVRSA
ncbi:MAG TPA: PP2C family protein-serine/threonine phosphatase [Acidisarcina sp.]